MAIRFRCPHCNQFLGISRARAGVLTDCPRCDKVIRVPKPGDEESSAASAADADITERMAPLPSRSSSQGALDSGESQFTRDHAEAGQGRRVRNVPSARSRQAAVAASVLSPPVPPSRPLKSEVSRDGAAETRSPGSESEKARPQATWSGVLLIGGCLASLALGVVLGSLWTRRPANEVAATSVSQPTILQEVQKPVPPEPVHLAPQRPVIEGSVRFISQEGGLQPDEGARVIALPWPRAGNGLLAYQGFLADAVGADRELLYASAAGVGGDFTVADTNGVFTLSLSQPGVYGVLVASRQRPRPDLPLNPGADRFLKKYFDRPELVIGPVQYDFREVSVDAVSPRTVQVEFTR